MPVLSANGETIHYVKEGTGPAIVAALAGGAAADFFFFAPFYSFRIDDPQEVVDLLLFLFVALVSGHLASRLRSEKDVLRQRETELQYLYEFSRRLAACSSRPPSTTDCWRDRRFRRWPGCRRVRCCRPQPAPSRF